MLRGCVVSFVWQLARFFPQIKFYKKKGEKKAFSIAAGYFVCSIEVYKPKDTFVHVHNIKENAI